MGGLSLIVTIVRKNLSEKFIDFYKLYSSSIILSIVGRGTASSAVLDYLGLEKTEKTILFTLAKKDTAKTIIKELVYTMNIDTPGAGIGMSLPISSIGSQSAMAFLEHSAQEGALNISSETKEGKPMTDSQYSLIIVITNVGCTEMVMGAARSGNASGGTIIHAKGTGLDRAEKFFGISLSSEKEMIFITTLTKDKNNIMKAIMNDAGMNTEAQSVVISLPVDSVVGLRSLEHDIEDN